MSKTGTLEGRTLDDAELDAVTGGVVVEKIGPDLIATVAILIGPFLPSPPAGKPGIGPV